MAVKVCPKCAESNAESALSCSACGATLKDVAVTGTLNSDKYEGKYRSGGEVPCSGCGELLDEGSRKCKYCGTSVYKKPEIPRYEVTADAPLFRLGAFAIILLVITTVVYPPAGLIIGGVAAFSEDQDHRITGKVLMLLGLVVIAVKHFI